MASVLKACSSLAALEQGKQLHARTVKYGFGLEVPIGSALSSMYAKCGSLDNGSAVFSRMPWRDVISWNSMISGLSQNGHACSHMGLVETGQAYFKMMIDDYGLEPKVDHYACMVDLLSRAGKLHEAKAFIESVPIDHGLCSWRILLGACRNYRSYEIGAYAGERLMELGSPESSAYILLASIYSSMERWHDVQRVRSMMKHQGVAKEPGCSWIDIKNQVHVFVAGDQLHPQIGEIRVEVKKLTKQMKDQGYRPNADSLFRSLSNAG